MKYGEGKEYSCRDKAEKDMDLMGVDSPPGLIHSIHNKHFVEHLLCTRHSGCVREIKPNPTSAGTQSGGIAQSYEQTTVTVFCEEAEEGVGAGWSPGRRSIPVEVTFKLIFTG